MMRRFVLVLLASQFALVACTCNKKPTAPTLRKEGDACNTDDSCETGLCDAKPGNEAVCVRKCAIGCTDSEVCTQLTPNRFSCQKDRRQLCAACEIDSDCPYPSDRCVVVNGERVCGRDCAFDQNCPSGYACRNALGTDGKAKLQQCTPAIASCACLARGDLLQPCSVVNGFGSCPGVKTCDLVSNQVACSALVPSAEACNGIDDNCNGTIDENQQIITCGIGACQRSVSTCQLGGDAGCVEGAPTEELCNGIDDDCNGVIDNGYPVLSDPSNCGGCGIKCADKIKNADPLCSNGLCDYGMCYPGYRDVDGDRTNGCEFACGTTDRPDYEPLDAQAKLFVDANCDDFDGIAANGIFVSKSTGNDANEGSMIAPKETIQAGLAALTLTNKQDLYVAAGSYAGPIDLNLASGIIIAGGYHPTTWRRSVANLTVVQGGNPAIRIETSADIGVQLIRFVGDAAGQTGDFSAYGAWVAESTGIRMTGVSISAGAGATGAPGTAGAPGAAGGNGGGGDGAKIVDSRATATGIFCNAVNNGDAPIFGAAGVSMCNTAGGAGGSASKQNAPDQNSSNVGPGASGSSAPGGGLGGVGVVANGTPGGPNQGGDYTLQGTNGAAATVAAPAGSFTATGWTPGHGADGQPGTSGKGGGGGGGGAGGWATYVSYYCQCYGSTGGGGGAGGCGGGAGLGGQGGGASIGLFVRNSALTGLANSLLTGNGGAGGAGGPGGSAGPGGTGGSSPVPSVSFGTSNRATQGGKGGNGSAGGSGGGGSGGAGGSVIGIAKSNTSTVTGFSPTLGTAGAGGSGVLQGPAGTRHSELLF